ncbi:cobalamin binding intrinsic factor [Pelodytes ibericus]
MTTDRQDSFNQWEKWALVQSPLGKGAPARPICHPRPPLLSHTETVTCAGESSHIQLMLSSLLYACAVPDEKKSLVTALVLNMANSVAPCLTPDPSVLLALNLGNYNLNPAATELLVKQLREDAVQKVSQNLGFTSGKVALYTLALRSSCSDPTKIPMTSGNLNLVDLLQMKTQEETVHIEQKNSPLTTYYQVSLDVLALCVMRSPQACPAGLILAKAATSHGSSFFVDTASVAAMAFACVYEMDNVRGATKQSVKTALSKMLNLILNKQDNGMIGNIYSTGLAGQALTAAKGLYSSALWNCSLTLQKIFEEIPKGSFSLPIASAQVLPFLYGKSYVSVKEMQCQATNATLIVVDYTIVNDLTGDNFKYSIQVAVPEGSTVLEVMEKAAEISPKEFSFTTEDTNWGKYVTAINHLSGNTNQKTYWQFFSGTASLQEGVSSYKPHNKEHILAIFSKY